MPERDQQSLQSARYSTRIVLPQFIPREPQVWFAVSEQVFQTHKIICESERYSIAVAALDPKYALEVKDIILKPPAEKPYTAFKEALIARLGSSQEQQLRQLLEREEIGDRKPSQFLRHLQHLAGSAVGDDFVRTLWMSRLPASMQGILTTQKNESLVKQAELADAIGDATSSAQVNSVRAEPAGWEIAIAKLTAEMAALNTKVDRAYMPSDGTHRSSRSRFRSSSRPRSRSRSIIPGQCWYHNTFGEKAKKCQKPCDFAGNANGPR
ncbi:unnamed protein product [Hermetia illucens]|uniref:DUF7041 domain-containing protein n=1 Tax=Hermetia illucens TaxID=343691 RepID=A0A7R8Z048_HERIL|nr:unnamed protein product [Hermetia illucens]